MTKVEKIKTRLGLMDRLQGEGQVETWRRWTEAMVKSEVKIDEPSGSCDDMKWIISFEDQGWCMCCINTKLEPSSSMDIYVAHTCVPVD